MKKGVIKKVIITGSSVFVLLVLVLCIHIYLVTRPKAPDENTIIMARIDINQSINDEDAQKITSWMYMQQGIDHVLCNASMKNIVFTFRPVQANANEIVSNLKSTFSLSNAVRYLPGEKELKGGCPVATTSYSYRIYNFFYHML